jgi:hypothetical protein
LNISGAQKGLAAPRWEIRVGEATHVLDLVLSSSDGPMTFLVDGVEHSLGRWFRPFPPITRFEMGGPATLECRVVWPNYGIRVKRALGAQGRWSPAIVLGYLLGGIGFGAGAASGAAAGSLGKRWLIYSLSVADQDEGSWVAETERGRRPLWNFVGPGAKLPDGSDTEWRGGSP